VFFFDNGGLGNLAGGINYGDDNGTLNGFKGVTFEGGIRVPFLIREPGLQHSVYDSPILEQDLMPTLVNAAGGDASQFQTDGVDLTPHLSGTDPTPAHQEEFWRNRGIWAVRKGDWKLERPSGSNVFGFYNIATDQSESHNLIGTADPTLKAKIAELGLDLTNWEATVAKPKFGILGADDRNKFDHFVFRNNLVATTSFSTANAWQEFGNPAHNVTMLVDDAYANDVIEFTTRDDANYSANNDLTRMSGSTYMLNQVQFTGTFGGDSAQSGTVKGNSLLFVKDLNGNAPRIQLDATSSGAANFTFNLNNELVLLTALTIAGDGTQNFVIGGVIRDYYDPRDANISTPHDVLKIGASNVTLAANNTFTGTLTINGGQVHVNGASAAISAASRITISSGGALVLDSGSIAVPIIDNALHLNGDGSQIADPQGDYNHDHRVDALDYTLWRDSVGQMGDNLAADGNGDGSVNQQDFDVWSANFGKVSGGGDGGTNGGLLSIKGGTLRVSTITGNLVNSGGTLAPGATAGIRSIGGNLKENAGILQVLLSGLTPGASPGFDVIQVGGTATLGGTLLVQLGNFAPTIGQTFDILTATGGLSGTFSTVAGSPGAGKAWQLTYGPNDLTLSVVAGGSAANVFMSGYRLGGDSQSSAFVSEPSTLCSLAVGAASFGLYRAHRRRAGSYSSAVLMDS
jgi:autotransporter-associated beta strand protein